MIASVKQKQDSVITPDSLKVVANK